MTNFDVLLTVHLSIFILVINQLDAQNCIIQPLVSSHSVGGRPMHRTATYRRDDTRGCTIQL